MIHLTRLSILLLIFTAAFISCKYTSTKYGNNIQKATIKSEDITLKTYAFSDPDPVPNIGTIYPYFKFEGYTNNGVDKAWKMVVMENEYIKVFVCPEIGGKVWGAIEKSTGKEFLYFNNVVKFRNIAMRGPWTSGGLEFNFGDIGHAPSCSTPVDYQMKENEDGSVSCIIGAYDLPSRTRWNIDIRLPRDKAFLETKVSWFNSTDQHTSYYHWMNAAAKASGNLTFHYPGDHYIGHVGESGDWPLENSRNLSEYEQNNFGGYKSYHVLNAYSNVFGGYWKEDDFGFGHFVPYDEKPGKKLWIWGLSQQGMIWEDLLTDSDGQYIEYQAGKLFNQASPGSSLTPFKHKEFEPYASDIMTELWFPLKETKGMVTASHHAVLNVERKSDSTIIYLSALQFIDAPSTLQINGKTIHNHIKLAPMEVFTFKIPGSSDTPFYFTLGDHLLDYKSQEPYTIDRPIETQVEFNWNSAYGLYTNALELEKQRLYTKAQEEYLRCIEKDPGFLPAYSRLALGYYRKMDYQKALDYCLKGLSIDTYHPESNYAYGLVNKNLGMMAEAKSGFSIASQSLQFRSAAYTELGILCFLDNNYKEAIHYAMKSIENNRNNIKSYMIMAYTHRKSGIKKDAQSAIKKIYSLDPLSDFARFEEVILKTRSTEEFKSSITNELPHESYLELAAQYLQLYDTSAAITVLKECPDYPIVDIWLASLEEEKRSLHLERALNSSANMVFPHRAETAQMLQDLIKEYPHWKLKYYLGLILWNKGLIEQAQDLFLQCKDKPDFPAFYLAKNELIRSNISEDKKNLDFANRIDPKDWRTGLALSNYHLKQNDPVKAISILKEYIQRYPENAQIGMNYVKSLMQNQDYQIALDFLKVFNVLPFEGSTQGKELYTSICINLALESFKNKDYKSTLAFAEKAKEWPQILGVGKPYVPDDRLADIIIARAHEMKGNNSYYSRVTDYQTPDKTKENANLYLQWLASKKMRKSDGSSLIRNAMKKDPSNKYLRWVNAKINRLYIEREVENELLKNEEASSKKEFRDLVKTLVILDM